MIARPDTGPLIRQTDIRGFEYSRTKVSAMTYSRANAGCIKDLITVYESAGVYSKASEFYLSVFLLRFARGLPLQGRTDS